MTIPIRGPTLLAYRAFVAYFEILQHIEVLDGQVTSELVDKGENEHFISSCEDGVFCFWKNITWDVSSSKGWFLEAFQTFTFPETKNLGLFFELFELFCSKNFLILCQMTACCCCSGAPAFHC